MIADYLSLRLVVEPGNITASKARDLIRVLESGVLHYARLIECRTWIGGDIVVVEVEPQLSQKRAYPIRPHETLAIEFDRKDQFVPQVYALRDDFPIVPHLNLMPNEFPRCLCLYQERYRQLKRYWTAPKFIEDIRRWLSLTAKGMLHGVNQALEPIILNSPVPIIMPSVLTEEGNEGFIKLIISGIDEDGLLRALMATKLEGEFRPWRTGAYIGLVLNCPPQQHGVIRRHPNTLKELNDLTLLVGFNLVEALSEFLLEVRREQNALAYPLVLIVLFPKTRDEEGVIETVDKFAFLTRSTLFEIGENIGIWARPDGLSDVGLLHPRDTSKDGEQVDVLLLNLNQELSRERAALLNGFSAKNDTKVTAIGAGALGSQMILNLIRSGFGLWTVVDDDRLLPHNLARHAMPGAVGELKASVLSEFINTITPDERVAKFIKADIIASSNDDRLKLEESFCDSNLILDMSANTSVGRYLAQLQEYPARRVSFFLNPLGTDLICLAENKDRSIRLDHLDVQYYRAIIANSELAGHLHAPGRLRYGQSCRDLSSTIPQDYIALLSAVASRTVHNLSDQADASIAIWRIDPADLRVTPFKFTPVPMIEIPLGEWRLITDNVLSQKIFEQRSQQLPNETGGVLIGSWDMERKIVYVLDMIPAPPDSLERKTLFIRGCEGLRSQLKEIENKTLYELGYVGEWHSHPDGFSGQPSGADLMILDWIKLHMGEVGLPALMMIACENRSMSWFLDDEIAYNVTEEPE
jgi:integrative and conjugative element protein (TIGR02256 family)